VFGLWPVPLVESGRLDAFLWRYGSDAIAGVVRASHVLVVSGRRFTGKKYLGTGDVRQ
jgi:hypothetical protein